MRKTWQKESPRRMSQKYRCGKFDMFLIIGLMSINDNERIKLKMNL
jgi:hypothetical protein